jgi:hypothetical protein
MNRIILIIAGCLAFIAFCGCDKPPQTELVSEVQPQWRGKPADFSHGPLVVSENKHYLVHADGTPLFWLGDTAWELFNCLDKEEAEMYLTDRAGKGFSVIQVTVLSGRDNMPDPNVFGYYPLEDGDPTRPAVKEGPDNDYWDHVDWIVNRANELGMYIGFLPTWGNFWHNPAGGEGTKPLLNPDNAERYAEFVGNRYKDKQVIWILGGDNYVENESQRATIVAMARGLEKADGGEHLITFHPKGAAGSSEYFQEDDWLDFNMRQTSHFSDYTNNYSNIAVDYARRPTKPVIDGEPLYEAHPLSFDAPLLGHSIASDIRRPFYWTIFDGAFGITYGHHSIWQMYDPAKRRPSNSPLMSWQEALDAPGAIQMMYGRMLMQSRPFLTRIPDPSIIVTGEVPTAMPGEGRYRFVATRDEAGTYAMVYAPVGREFSVRMDAIKGDKVTAWWFNPRTGKSTKIATFVNARGEHSFMPPDPGEMLDWVLVLDDAACKYPAPGTLLN